MRGRGKIGGWLQIWCSGGGRARCGECGGAFAHHSKSGERATELRAQGRLRLRSFPAAAPDLRGGRPWRSSAAGSAPDNDAGRVPPALCTEALGPKMAGKGEPQQASTTKVAAVVLFYFVISISLVFLNKVLLSSPGTSIDAPLFVTW